MQDKKLLQEMRKIFNKYDPMGIFYKEIGNVDEYDPEIKDIIKNLDKCKNLDDVHNLVYNMFVKWFKIVGKEGNIAGSKERFAEISHDIFNKFLKK